MIQRTVTTRQDDRLTCAASPVLLIGLLSGALYLVVYLAQRALFRNGLLQSFAEVTARGDPASRSWLLVQCAAYYGATAALLILYVRLLTLCRRGRLRDGWARALALLFPALFNLGLLLGRPYLSIDVFTYIAYGTVGANSGGNPYVQPVTAVTQVPLGAQLIASGWRPNHIVPTVPYGPLWVQIETAVLRLTRDVPTATLLLKGLVIAASLGSAALIWVILGRVRPADQLLGTLIYLWNPVIIVEFAAEGHNDALMILCALAALLLTVGARPALSLAMLALGVLAKFVPLILLPAQLAFFWHTRHTRRERARLAPPLLLGLLVSLGLAALLYGPLWAGAATFNGLRAQGEPHGAASTVGALFLVLTHSPLHAAARPLTLGLLDGIFGVFVLLVSWRVRDAGGLLSASACIAAVYLLVALPVYWPWYATLPIALLALSPRGALGWMALALTVCTRLAAPLEVIDNRGFLPPGVSLFGTDVIAIALPLLVALLLIVREWREQGGRRQGGRVAPSA